MLKQFSQLSQLSLSELWILLIALFLLPITAIVLEVKGFSWTQSFLDRCSSKINPTVPVSFQLLQAKNIAKIVAVAANHGPYRANCLKKSLVTKWLLAKRGIQSDLKIGVNTDKGNFSAHSWIEFQGAVLHDASDINERFSIFDSE
jgi:hypothetical protein